MTKLLCYSQDRTLVCVESKKKVSLRPKPYEVLIFLLSRQGVCVSKDEIFEACWSGLIVSEQSLTNTIGVIRKALRELSSDDIQITTVSKSGYILYVGYFELIDGNSCEVEVQVDNVDSNFDGVYNIQKSVEVECDSPIVLPERRWKNIEPYYFFY